MDSLLGYANGQLLPADQIQIPMADLGILRGMAVFETMRSYSGVAFRLEQHLQRLRQSCAGLLIPWVWEGDTVAEAVRQTMERNQVPDAAIKVLVTGGEAAPDGRSQLQRPGLYITVHPFQPARERQEQGVKIITYAHERWMPEIKSVNYAPALLALQEAQRQDAWDALYVDRDGTVSECTMRNFFGVARDGTICTPASGILYGITRAEVISLCAELGIPLREGPLARQELPDLTEAFMTSTLVEVMPIIAIAGQAVGTGTPGPITRRLQQAFAERTQQLSSDTGISNRNG